MAYPALRVEVANAQVLTHEPFDVRVTAAGGAPSGAAPKRQALAVEVLAVAPEGALASPLAARPLAACGPVAFHATKKKDMVFAGGSACFEGQLRFDPHAQPPGAAVAVAVTRADGARGVSAPLVLSRAQVLLLKCRRLPAPAAQPFASYAFHAALVDYSRPPGRAGGDAALAGRRLVASPVGADGAALPPKSFVVDASTPLVTDGDGFCKFVVHFAAPALARGLRVAVGADVGAHADLAGCSPTESRRLAPGDDAPAAKSRDELLAEIAAPRKKPARRAPRTPPPPPVDTAPPAKPPPKPPPSRKRPRAAPRRAAGAAPRGGGAAAPVDARAVELALLRDLEWLPVPGEGVLRCPFCRAVRSRAACDLISHKRDCLYGDVLERYAADRAPEAAAAPEAARAWDDAPLELAPAEVTPPLLPRVASATWLALDEPPSPLSPVDDPSKRVWLASPPSFESLLALVV